MTAGEVAVKGGGEAQRRDADSAGELRQSHAEGEAAASDGPHGQALEGPFTTRQLLRLDEALRTADESTGLTFSVYVGDLTEPVRAHAEELHTQLPDRANGVLLAISPNQRVLEIVTGPLARRRLPDRDCKLAALSMTAAFSGGDLVGGIIAGLAQLANHGRRTT